MATSSLKYLLFITVMLLISTLIIIYSDGYDSHIDVRTANISNRDYNKLQNLVQSKTSADSTSIFSSVDSYSDGNSNSVNSARIQQKISNSQVVSNRAIVISDEEKTPPTVKPTEAVVLLSTISSNCSVTSDIFGNLGEPNVVTNGKVDDWLKDRWQCK